MTRLSAQEDFIEYCRRENFEIYEYITVRYMLENITVFSEVSYAARF